MSFRSLLIYRSIKVFFLPYMLLTRFGVVPRLARSEYVNNISKFFYQIFDRSFRAGLGLDSVRKIGYHIQRKGGESEFSTSYLQRGDPWLTKFLTEKRSRNKRQRLFPCCEAGDTLHRRSGGQNFQGNLVARGILKLRLASIYQPEEYSAGSRGRPEEHRKDDHILTITAMQTATRQSRRSFGEIMLPIPPGYREPGITDYMKGSRSWIEGE